VGGIEFERPCFGLPLLVSLFGEAWLPRFAVPTWALVRLLRLSVAKIPCGALVGFRENRDKASGSSTKFAHRT